MGGQDERVNPTVLDPSQTVTLMPPKERFRDSRSLFPSLFRKGHNLSILICDSPKVMTLKANVLAKGTKTPDVGRTRKMLKRRRDFILSHFN